MTTVLSLSTPQLGDVVALTRPTHEAFTNRWGFNHRHVEFPDMGLEEIMWMKPDLVYEELTAGNNVWWIDADAAVTNPSKMPYLGPDVTASCDINGLNAGVFYVENTVDTLRLFYACKTHGRTLFGDQSLGEQRAMQQFTSHEPYHGMITYIQQRAINSYWPGAYDYPGHETAEWQPGDFVLHLPGLPNERRVEILKAALNL
jgi:hypothetical protein